ncbi:hypothetical protein ACFQU2_12300 [Siccirubricoccus deserti]
MSRRHAGGGAGCCRLALQGSDVLIYEFRQAEGSPAWCKCPATTATPSSLGMA